MKRTGSETQFKPNARNAAIKSHNIARTALLFALAVTLSLLEGLFPSPMAGVKLGLSNIVVMYALFFLKKRSASAIALLKSFFVFLLKGPVAGLLSLCGGLLSVIVIASLIFLTKQKITYLLAGISGAVAHNLGQFCIASLLLGTPLWYYLPVLLLSGIGAGVATSVLLRITLPGLGKIKG